LKINYNCLIHQLRSMQVPVIAVAFTGIASLLLAGGRTAYSQFGLPLQVQENSTSSIKFQSRAADQLRETQVIIWDELSMIEGRMLNIVDLLLRDLTRDAMGWPSPYPFGGKIVLLGGDFRQELPVLPRANPTQVVCSTVKYCSLWKNLFVRCACVLTCVRRRLHVTLQHGCCMLVKAMTMWQALMELSIISSFH